MSEEPGRVPMHSEHFTEAELACHHCGRNECTKALLDALEQFRAAAGKPVHINDAYRCPEHNAKVGGAKNSQHLLGMAADIRVDGMTGRQLYEVAVRCPLIHGIGRSDYSNYLHIDVRSKPAKWCYDEKGREVTWYA